MKIVFTDHALNRCRQEQIDINSLKRQIPRMPLIAGKLRWVTQEGHVILLRNKGNNTILVITVIARRKYKSTAKGFNTI